MTIYPFVRMLLNSDRKRSSTGTSAAHRTSMDNSTQDTSSSSVHYMNPDLIASAFFIEGYFHKVLKTGDHWYYNHYTNEWKQQATFPGFSKN